MKGFNDVRPGPVDEADVHQLAGALLTALFDETGGAVSARHALSALALTAGALLAGAPAGKVKDATLARYVALVGDYAREPMPASIGGVALNAVQAN